MNDTGPTDLLRAMREEPIAALEDAEQASARRARVVPVLARAIEAEARAARARKVRAAWIGRFATAAAVGGLLIGLRLLGSPDAPSAAGSSAAAADAPPRPIVARVTAAGTGSRVVDGGIRSPTTEGMALPAGSRVETSVADRDAITTSTGVEIVVEASSSLVFPGGEAAEESVVLWSGKAIFQVPPGDRSRTFSVRTPDTVVTVHGTRFSVEAGPPVQVHVFEGVVSVLHAERQIVLRVGDTWSSRGDSDIAPSARRSATASSVGPTAPSSSARTSESDLARQNALYESAMAAKRRGDDAAVISALDSLLTRWPDSPLADEARRERARAAARRKP
jgi:hypothetical protein